MTVADVRLQLFKSDGITSQNLKYAGVLLRISETKKLLISSENLI